MRKKTQNAFVKIEEKKEIDLGTLIAVPVQQKKDFYIFEPNEWKDENRVIIGVHKIYKDVETPKYYTEKSACFDIPSYFGDAIVCVDSYNRLLLHVVKTVFQIPEKDNKRGISIEPGESVFIPTGLIFDIPTGFKISLFPRSGTAGKKHLKLSNCVGVIDEDYTKQLMLLVFNDSQQRQTICHGDRLAQAEIVPVFRALFEINENTLLQKTDRTGGFGTTGINETIIMEV